MNVTGLPVSVPLQVKDLMPGISNQQASASTQGAPNLNEVADELQAQGSSAANSTGEHSGDGSVRVKRGFKVRGFPRGMTSVSLNSPKIPTIGLEGKFVPASSLGPRVPVGPRNSKAISDFREIAFKTQHPGSSLSGPAKPVVAQPKTFGDVAANLIAADRLVKAGVFKTDTSLKTVTRDAFVNASINGLVSTPLSVGTYAGSVWSGESIKGSFTASTPLLPPAHLPAPSKLPNGVAAAGSTGSQDASMVSLRLENAEIKYLYAANTIQTLAEGGEAAALGKSPNWPTETDARLDTLEKLYGAAEKNLEAVATQNDFVFRPYKAEATPGTQDAAGRLDALDKRNEAINKGIGRLVAIRELETQRKE